MSKPRLLVVDDEPEFGNGKAEGPRGPTAARPPGPSLPPCSAGYFTICCAVKEKFAKESSATRNHWYWSSRYDFHGP